MGVGEGYGEGGVGVEVGVEWRKARKVKNENGRGESG